MDSNSFSFGPEEPFRSQLQNGIGNPYIKGFYNPNTEENNIRIEEVKNNSNNTSSLITKIYNLAVSVLKNLVEVFFSIKEYISPDINVNNYRTYTFKYDQLFQEGKYRQALRGYEKVIGWYQPTSLLEYADTLRILKNYKRADSEYDKIYKCAGIVSKNMNKGYGKNLFLLGQTEKAKAKLNSYLEIKKDDQETKDFLDFLSSEEGKKMPIEEIKKKYHNYLHSP